MTGPLEAAASEATIDGRTSTTTRVGDEHRAAACPVPVYATPETRAFPVAQLLTRRATPWYSLGWLVANFGHLIASAVAKSDIDGRDWMSPDEPTALAEQVARAAGFAHVSAGSLTDAKGADVWIDYVADTGDDADVSREVARLVARRYALTLPDTGEALDAPRGDLLFFGGDSAYPIATGAQLMLRLVDPWNDALAEADDGRTRALLATRGNHDWNDGLDGFGRLFRRKKIQTPDTAPPSAPPLALRGYVAVQDASYFVLPLAPELALFAPDRQLDKLDFRQRTYFDEFRRAHPQCAAVLTQGDPCFAFGQPNPHGQETREALGLATQRALILAGDSHHYVRLDEPVGEGATATHITAGGGGASLHPTMDSIGDTPPALRLWPSPAESSALGGAVPWRLWSGASGWLIHLALAALYTLFFGAAALLAAHIAWQNVPFLIATAVLLGIVLDASGKLFDGRPHESQWRGANSLTSLALAGIPFGVTLALDHFVPGIGAGWKALAAIGTGTLLGPLFIGSLFLWAVRAGVDQTMAFAALAHPGFKHFLRMRVRHDGSAIDVWCIGLRNPLEAGEPPVLVDSFCWKVRG